MDTINIYYIRRQIEESVLYVDKPSPYLLKGVNKMASMFYNFGLNDQDLIKAQVAHLKAHMKKHLASRDERKIRTYILKALESWDPRLAMCHPAADVLVEGMMVLRNEFGYKCKVLHDGNIQFRSGRNTLIETNYHGKDKTTYPEVAANIGFAIKYMPRHLMSDDE